MSTVLLMEAAMSECIFCVTLWPEPEVCGHPDRNPDPPDYTTGWERPAFCCGCGRGCSSWADHNARRDAEVTLPPGDIDAILDCLLGGELSAVCPMVMPCLPGFPTCKACIANRKRAS